MTTAKEASTAFMEGVDAADDASFGALFTATYAQLRSLAHGQRRRWRGQETMCTTALVNEAYLKLSRRKPEGWDSRAHFLHTAARAMRHILMDYAKRSRRAKRGGEKSHVPADEVRLVDESRIEELLALDEALTHLARENPRRAQVVECRFFAGMEVGETAEALGISPSTVMRDLRRGKAWLYLQLRA